MNVAHELDEGLNQVDHDREIWWNRFIKNLSQHVGQRSVMDLMSEAVVSVPPDAFLAQAAAAMLRERVHRLPVLDHEGRLLGIVSTTDVLRAFVDGAPSA